MSGDIPHPRDVFDYEGGEGVERAFVSALARGRLHHAWLLVGPEGVGKATFAYRAARRLLGAAENPAWGVLGAAPEDHVSRQIIARAHPDLMVLQRDQEDGKTRRGISVDEARALPEFFAKSPAVAPYRVAIIDAVDDLNTNAANAVLKTLEEPPARGVLLLISHSPGGLLPTIRSRCRRLRFSPPEETAGAAWVAARAGVDGETATRLLSMARGAPGAAWRLAASGVLEIDQTARDILHALPNLDEAAMQALADGFRGPAGQARFELLFDRLAEHVRALAVGQALRGGAALDRWAETWEMLTGLPGAVAAVNLDRADAFFTALSRLRAIA